MQKQYVRKMQKIGNGLGVRVPPELCQEAEVGQGDNVSLEFNPDSGDLKLGKVALANPVLDNVQPQVETRKNSENKSAENKSTENKSRVDLSDEKEQGQQDEIKKTEFCPSCGSDDIRQVTGNQFYCGGCKVTYEMTSRGAKVISTNPFQNVDDLEARVEQLENDVDEINDNSDKDKNSGGLLSRLGIEFGFVNGDEDYEDEDEDKDLVPVGAGENPGSDDDEFDENGDPKGFLTW